MDMKKLALFMGVFLIGGDLGALLIEVGGESRSFYDSPRRLACNRLFENETINLTQLEAVVYGTRKTADEESQRATDEIINSHFDTRYCFKDQDGKRWSGQAGDLSGKAFLLYLEAHSYLREAEQRKAGADRVLEGKRKLQLEAAKILGHFVAANFGSLAKQPNFEKLDEEYRNAQQRQARINKVIERLGIRVAALKKILLRRGWAYRPAYYQDLDLKPTDFTKGSIETDYLPLKP